MRRRLKVILIVVAAVVCSVIFFGPRLFRCYAYYEVIASRSSALTSLSGKFSKLSIPLNNELPALSLGYAQIAIRPELVNKIKYFGDGEFAIMISVKEGKILFGPPYLSDWPAMDPNSAASSHIPSIFALDPFGYRFGARAARTMPKKYSQLFFMSGAKFLEYFTLATAKSQNSFNQNGIGIFETPYIHGIVRFGELKKSNFFGVEIFSKESNIRQSLLVSSSDPEKSKKALLSLLASYRFVITEVPDKETLCELIKAEIEKHDKFEVSE